MTHDPTSSAIPPGSALSPLIPGPLAFLLAVVCLLAEPDSRTASAVALPRAHAHNDYEHPRPLLDALDHGFGSVEADIHLVDGQLLVAHDLHQTRPERTLEFLYLKPLRERARRFGGRIHPDEPEFILLIDIKSNADATYVVLRERLREYSDILTRFETGQIRTNAVTVILSGNRPRERLLAEADRLAAFDGRLADLDAGLPLDFMPLVSDNWRSHFRWRGLGPFPEEDRAKLADLVARTQAQGRQLRFWAAPDRLEAWRILHDAGVDLLNTDDLAGLRDFLIEARSARP